MMTADDRAGPWTRQLAAAAGLIAYRALHAGPTERLDRDALTAWQGSASRSCSTTIYGRNAFYTRKLDAAGIRHRRRCGFLDDLTRAAADHQSGAGRRSGGTIRPGAPRSTEPLDRYTRYCQTSSTTGRPLRWIDTNESWQWMLECWKAVYRGARVGPGDRVFFPFSFGPFLGFWAGFEAGCQMGVALHPRRRHVAHIAAGDDRGGRRDGRSAARRPTRCGWRRLPPQDWPDRPLCAEGSVRVLIVAGEPGGSIPATRERIERELGRARHRSSRADRSRVRSASSAGRRPGSCTSTKASTSARCSTR